MGARNNAYKVLIGKSEIKRSCGRPRHRWDIDSELDQTWGKCGLRDTASSFDSFE
jgi:hypothetical protein